MPLSPPTARSSRGAPVPRRVTSSRCGVRNDADLSSPDLPPRTSSGSRLILTVSKTRVDLSGPARVRSPNRSSPPAGARPQRRSWPSTTHRPRTPRAARRAELRCPPTQHHHCGRLMARIGSDPSRRSRSRTVVHRPVVDGDPDDRAVEQPSPPSRYRDAGVIFFARSPVMPNTTNASARRSSLVLAGGRALWLPGALDPP